MARTNTGHSKAGTLKQADRIEEEADQHQPGWHRPQNKKEERKWLEELVDYLYIDPPAQENVAVLRFLLMEWRDMKGSIYKADGLDKVKTRLSELEAVRFLRKNEDTNQYEYWRDHSEAGRLAFMTFATSPATHGDKEDTTKTTVMVDHDDEKAPDGETHAVLEVDKDEVTKPSEIWNTMDDKEPRPFKHEARDTMDTSTMTKEQQRTTGGMRTTPSEYKQMVAMVPKESTVTTEDKTEPHHNSTGTEEEPEFILTKMKNPYTGTFVTVKSTPTRTSMRQKEVAQQEQRIHNDSEGVFIPVVPRKKKTAWHRQLNHQAYYELLGPGVEESKEEPPDDIRTPDEEPTLPTAAPPFGPAPPVRGTTPEPTMQTPPPPLPTLPNIMDATHHPAELVQALNTVLQYKIQEAVRTLDTHQKAWISMIGYREDHIKAQLREAESQMKAHLVQETEYLKQDIAKMAHTIQSQTMDTIQQNKLATQSWMQVESAKVLEKLTSDLQEHQVKHKKHIEEFCMDELDALQSNLDGYKANVANIHEELRTQCPPVPQNRYVQTIPPTEEEPATIRRDALRSPMDPMREHIPVQVHPQSTSVDEGQATTTRTMWRGHQVNIPNLTQQQEREHERTGTRPSDQEPHPERSPTADPTRLPPHGDRDNRIDMKYQDPDYQIGRLRSTSTPMQLRSRERKAVITFYNSFVDFLKMYRVPIKIFDLLNVHKLDSNHEHLYPSDMEQEYDLRERYSAAIYARLEEDGILDTSDQMYMGLLQMYNSTRDGYSLLKALLAATVMVESKNVGILNTPPMAVPGSNPYGYAVQLQEFYRLQNHNGRGYPPQEQALMYLQAMQRIEAYTQAATQLIQELEQVAPLRTSTVPSRFLFPQLPVTLATKQGLLGTDNHAPSAHLNVTRAGAGTSDMTRRRTADGGTTGRQYSGMARYSHRDTHRTAQNTRPPGTAQRHYETKRNTHRPDIQCRACGTYGHDLNDCKWLPRTVACMEYAEKNTTVTKDILRQYKRSQHPDTRQATRDRMIRVLQGELGDPARNYEDLVDRIIDGHGDSTDDGYNELMFYTGHEVEYDDNMEEADTTPVIYQTRVSMEETTRILKRTIHPVHFPTAASIDFAATCTIGSSTTPAPPESTEWTTKILQITVSQDLADTGASVSATGMKHILHNFTEHTKFKITGYDGTQKCADGQGFARILNRVTGKIDEMLFVYGKDIDGTIISLEHHARTNPGIHRWSQEATPSDESGWITFYDAEDQVVARYATTRRQGLYYIQELEFIPVLRDNIHSTADETRQYINTSVHTEELEMPNDTSDFHIDIEREHFPYLLGSQLNTNPIRLTPPHHQLTQCVTSMEQDVLRFHMWHQRLAHCSEKKLRNTQKYVDGIPSFKHSTLPKVVTCRACDIAKLRKAPKGSTTMTEPQPQLGQMFQMDIGFIRGPTNLEAVVDRREEAHTKLIDSRQGYSCYLLIIDRRSRYLWAFPLKTKSVQPTLIDTFLTIHGYKGPAPDKVIRSDGEGSLAASAQFRKLVARHGFLVQSTATDTSSQNGLAERPHRTLGTMVRCLLYSSGLNTMFWADALVYAAYIYNRLYHSGIHEVPYNVWTGKRANLTHIRAFGAHITVRKSGNRPTKTDPHHYTGIFLRFGATEKNIVYFDTVTQREKLARHCAVDEFHYGSTNRPPGAQKLLEICLPTAQKSGGSLHPQEATVEEYITDTTGQVPILDTVQPDMDAREDPPLVLAAAAKLYATMDQEERRTAEILHMEWSPQPYCAPVTVDLKMNRLPTLGLHVTADADTGLLYLQSCQEGTQASRIPRWRSMIRDAVLRRINGMPITTKTDFVTKIGVLRDHGHKNVTIEFAKVDSGTVNQHCDIPQMHFDQLRHIHRIQSVLTPDPWSAAITLTRSQLKKRTDYQKWREAEWAQHDKYMTQQMFGDPRPRPPQATVLPFVWTYLIKEDPKTGEPIYKARGTCNGGKRYGKAVTIAETYATCVEQPACRIFWSIAASANLVVMGADAGNAFAEAPPPVDPFYMIIDDQYREWWTDHRNLPPIPSGHVLPVNHALQGHPEAPRLWETHIHDILVTKLNFTPTTHEKCLYIKRAANTDIFQMLLRQVDDFAIAATDKDTCQQTIRMIGKHLTVPLNDLGVIRKFNGVNVHQTKWYITISCEDYISKLLEMHDWTKLKAAHKPIPMRDDSTYQRVLELAHGPTTSQEQDHIQKQAGFSYRAAIGELIYAMVVARPDISFATTKLSQYATNPAIEHYNAVQQVFAYLNHTKSDGLTYWRLTPSQELPDVPPPQPRSSISDRPEAIVSQPHEPLAYSDSDWGSDRAHRKSVTGMLILLGGAAVVYKTKYQKAVALSSTEAEFVSASDTGKSALYVRSILDDLGFQQTSPTKLHIDNAGAVFMVSAQAPTKRTRHVDIRYFALLDWSTTKRLMAVTIPTDKNPSDAFTKAVGRTKFHQHADSYMGRIPPTYTTCNKTAAQVMSLTHQHSRNTLQHSHLDAFTYPLFRALIYDQDDTTQIPESMGG